jgi:hypothetical protein
MSKLGGKERQGRHAQQVTPSPKHNHPLKISHQHVDTQKGITTLYHHDHHQDRKKPPIITTWEAEQEEETATIMGYP